MILTIPDFNAGVLADPSTGQTPLNALTDARNVRLRDGQIELNLGEADQTTPSIVPLFLMPCVVAGTNVWMYAGQNKVYVTDGSTHTNLTRQTTGVDVNYAASLVRGWNGGVLNGIPVVNNGVDIPQMWNPVSLTQRLQALTGWPATATCKAIAPFGTYLIAMNITKGSTNYPHMVKWSHSADVGAVPTSWDEADPTKDAGENELAGEDPIVGGLALGDQFVVYKQSSAHVMRYTGPPYIFNFAPLFSEHGAAGPNAFTALGRSHVVLTQSDLIMHSGTGAIDKLILTSRMRKWLFSNIDEQYLEKCFVIQNPFFSEIIVGFPEVGSSTCNLALVWNWRDDALTVRDLRSVHHAATGPVTAAGVSDWDSDYEQWTSDLSGWNKDSLVPAAQRVLLARDTPALTVIDSGTVIGPAFITGYIERTGIAGENPAKRYLLKGIRPRINAPDGTVIKIRGGASERILGSVTWGTEVTFTVGTDFRADMLVSGRYIAYRIGSDAAYGWSLEGLDLEIEEQGDF